MQNQDKQGGEVVVVCKLEKKIALGKLGCVCQARLYLGRISAVLHFNVLFRVRKLSIFFTGFRNQNSC